MAVRSLGYDLAGRMVSASHPSGTLGYGYDDRGLLTQVTGPAGSATYTYDPAGRMTQRVDAAGTATFTWTPRSELESVDDPITGTFITYTWDAASQLETVTYGSGQAPVRALVFDDQGRLVSDTLQNASQTVASFGYGYDDDGNIVSVDVDLGGNPHDGLHSYGYDHAGRLVSWTDPAQTTISYGWDAASNRITAGTESFSYDQRNRLVASPDGTHAHTPRGTLAAIGATGYDFDALGRLVEADGVTYTFDALDRVATRNTVAFIYNDPGRHPVSDGDHVWSRSPGGRLIAQDDGTNARLVGLNRHGDLTYLYTTAGVVTDTVVYDPFGDPAAATGTGGSTLGFQGDWTDPVTDQVWMGARWYQPAHAAFTSRDTLQGELATPVSLNRYTYAAANPLVYWDPDGRQAAFIDDPLGGLGPTRTRSTTRSHNAAADRLSGLADLYQTSPPPSSTASAGAMQAAVVTEQRRKGTLLYEPEAYPRPVRDPNAPKWWEEGSKYGSSMCGDRPLWPGQSCRYDGRAAQLHGSLDADNIAIMFPGTGQNIDDYYNQTGVFSDARALHERMLSLDPSSATIAALTYDTPEGLASAVTSGCRGNQSDQSSQFVQSLGLRAEQNVTLMGHSCGGRQLVDVALANADIVDSIVYLGAPGTGIYGIGNLFETRAELEAAGIQVHWMQELDDPIRYTRWWPQQSYSPGALGGIRIPGDGLGGHSSYYERRSLRNLAGIATGNVAQTLYMSYLDR